MANNRTCKVCGKKYSYCPTCGEDLFKPSWMTLFCSANCYDTFITLSNFSNKKITENDARKELSKLNLDNITNETMKLQIQELFQKTVRAESESVIEKETEEIEKVNETVASENEYTASQDSAEEERTVLVVAEDKMKKVAKPDKRYYGKKKQ